MEKINTENSNVLSSKSHEQVSRSDEIDMLLSGKT